MKLKAGDKSGISIGSVALGRNAVERKQERERLQVQNRMLAVLSESAARYLEFPFATVDFQLIADQLLKLTGALVVFVQSYDETTGHIITEALAGSSRLMTKGIKHLGFNPLGERWPVDDKYKILHGAGKITRIDGLYEMTFGQIPGEICSRLEKMLGLGDIYGIGLVHRGQPLGHVVIVMPAGVELAGAGIVEIFASTVTAAILRKKAEQSLLESQERYRHLLEHCRDAVFVVTPEKRYIEANPAACRMLGYEREEFLQMEIWDLLLPEDLEVGMNMFSKLVQQGFVLVNLPLRAKDGGIIPCEINGAVMPDGNYLGTVRDVTERKRFEKEMSRLERLNTVGEMAARIGHEIRNPIAAVRGFLQILSKNRDNYNQYMKYFDVMVEELDRANSIISEFLSLAKNSPIDFRRHNLNSILRALFPLMRADAASQEKNITLDLNNVPDLPLGEKEIRQLILNLVRNGLEAMSPGKSLVIRTFTDAGEVVLAVQDQGSGLDPALIDRIGTPFFTTKDTGTGLGLAVCYSIAERHNATITAETGPGGTTFFVRLKKQIIQAPHCQP
ncbi:MAG: PAS domain S-box protein [Bacillota bacterium]